VLVKEPERAAWLAEAVRLAMGGATVNAIATWLTVACAPLPRGSSARRTSGSEAWNRQTVEGLLRNPILAGMTPHNPGRAKSGKRADPLSVFRDENGDPLVNGRLAVISIEEFKALQRSLDSRGTPQARKRSEREATSPFLSRVVRCHDCLVYLCRGTNQKRAVLYCPSCRQTIGRAALDPYLVQRLLNDRGPEPLGRATVRDQWAAAGSDDLARREVFLSQLETLSIRRGVVGRSFDEQRVQIVWRPATTAGPRLASGSETREGEGRRAD
jgi:hypothetical protein